MKKIILTIFLFASLCSNAQCEYNLDELLNLMVSNSSDYETKILTKGYEYDSKTETYYCDLTKNPFGLTKRFVSGNFYGFIYSIYSKENYLSIKNRIIEMNFKFSKTINVSNTEGYQYISKNIRITLFTKTENLIPNYNIVIEADLLKTK